MENKFLSFVIKIAFIIFGSAFFVSAFIYLLSTIVFDKEFSFTVSFIAGIIGGLGGSIVAIFGPKGDR